MPLLPTYWSEDAQPLNTTLDNVIKAVRNDDLTQGLLYDYLTVADIEELGEPIPESVTMDAIIVQNAKMKAKMLAFKRVLNQAGKTVKAEEEAVITKPRMVQGVAQIAAVFALSDGQAITVFFHNPDTTPKRITPTDYLFSYKFMLNKKDVTIVVAPERGKEIDLRQVARRLMALAEKNKDAFARQNAKTAERKANIERLKAELEERKGILSKKLKQLSDLEDFAARQDADAEMKAKEQAEKATQADQKNAVIELSGKEFGEYSDIKELRAKVSEHLDGLVGKWVHNDPMNMDIEIRKRGNKKTLSNSANPKKLKLLAALEQILKTAKPDSNAYQDNYKSDEKPNATHYFHLRNSAVIEGEQVRFDVIIEKDKNGALHYDLYLDEDKAKLKTKAAMDSVLLEHNSKVNIHNDFDMGSDNTLSLDDTQGGYVLNLFVYDKDGNLIEDEEQKEETQPVQFEPDGGEYLLYGRGRDGYEQLLFTTENREHFELLKKIHADKIKADGFTHLREKIYQREQLEKPDFTNVLNGETEKEVQTNEPIVLAGDELGKFDTTTEEGKKALREAAFNHLVSLAENGETVFCTALNANVGFTKSGAKKYKRYSGNPIKSKMMAKIKEIIASGKKFQPSQESYDKSEKLTYHYLKSAVIVDGEEYGARIVIREDSQGKFHYDLQVADNVALITDSVQKETARSYEANKSSVSSRLSGGKPYEVNKAPVSYHHNSNLTATDADSTTFLDDTQGGYVLNLFVYDKDGNLIEDEYVTDNDVVEIEKDSETNDLIVLGIDYEKLISQWVNAGLLENDDYWVNETKQSVQRLKETGVSGNYLVQPIYNLVNDLNSKTTHYLAAALSQCNNIAFQTSVIHHFQFPFAVGSRNVIADLKTEILILYHKATGKSYDELKEIYEGVYRTNKELSIAREKQEEQLKEERENQRKQAEQEEYNRLNGLLFGYLNEFSAMKQGQIIAQLFFTDYKGVKQLSHKAKTAIEAANDSETRPYIVNERGKEYLHVTVDGEEFYYLLAGKNKMGKIAANFAIWLWDKKHPQGEIEQTEDKTTSKTGGFKVEDIQTVTATRIAHSFEEARAEMQKFKGQILTNEFNGMQAIISGNNIDKILSGKASKQSHSLHSHLTAAANADELFKKAILSHTEQEKNNDPNFVGVHKMLVKLNESGSECLVKLTVKEMTNNQGSRVYSLETIDIESGAMPELPDADTQNEPTSGGLHSTTENSVTQANQQFKADLDELISVWENEIDDPEFDPNYDFVPNYDKVKENLDLYEVFDGKTLYYVKAVKNLIESAEKAGASIVFKDLEYTKNQLSMFDSVDLSRGNFVYGITAQLAKGDKVCRVGINDKGNIFFYKGASGADAIREVGTYKNDKTAKIIEMLFREEKQPMNENQYPEEMQFLQDVADGKIDVLADDFHGKITQAVKRLQITQPELCKKAINAYMLKTDEYGEMTA